MKRLKFLIVILAVCLLQGCTAFNNPKYIHFGTKSSPSYYTNEVYSKILSNENFTMVLFINNLYKDISIDSSENEVIKDFIFSIPEENYMDEDPPSETEPYELRLEFEDGSKYIINVYNDKLVSLYPWDGNYKEDVISMEKVPIHYNLYDFCTHVEKEAKALK